MLDQILDEVTCLPAFYKLYHNSTVSSATEKGVHGLQTLVHGIFSLQNALLFTNFGSDLYSGTHAGSNTIHYFRAVHKVRVGPPRHT